MPFSPILISFPVVQYSLYRNETMCITLVQWYKKVQSRRKCGKTVNYNKGIEKTYIPTDISIGDQTIQRSFYWESWRCWSTEHTNMQFWRRLARRTGLLERYLCIEWLSSEKKWWGIPPKDKGDGVDVYEQVEKENTHIGRYIISVT